MDFQSRKFIIIAVLVCFYVVAVAQPSTKKVLFKLDKPVNAFSRTGFHSVYPAGTNSSMLTARVEFGETKDGFTIRNEFHMWKYDDNFKLLWEADLKKNLTLQALPHTSTIGDEKNCFFIEKSYSGDQFVQKIDEKGNVTNTKVEGIDRTFIMNHFLINHDAAFLDGILNKKEDKLVYQLTSIGSSGKFKVQGIDAPWDDFEYAELKEGDAKEPLNSIATWPISTPDAFTNILNSGCSWHVAGEIGDRQLLTKSYFKDIEKSKMKELVIQTTEMDANGKLYNHRKWKFDTQFLIGDTKLMTPKVEFDEVNKELLIFGYIAVDGNRINSLYLIKYDYQSQKLLYSKVYIFDKIFRESKSKKTHNNISASVRAEVPRAITSYDYHLNKKDKILSVQIIANYHGATTTYFEVKFDKNGDHVQTDLVEYGTYNFNYQQGVKSLPEFHETLMKDTSRPYFTSARPLANDYLNNNASESKDKIYAFTIDRLNYSIIVYYNEDTGEFSALKIK